ncbi:kelch motif domain-containing protein, putative [Eimeria necatrix]|uniref:Kelch motif domain-containing protein, putative n=1 Tax=Eimeria necatrix TaxID=51315 RepID=U6MSY4_9EIME|nr:kelch motif domain-containing protein, putative [Eimeria necatrix]CDJ66203.1 kelch motif domain-containing protein, putative [Eimeria necatrix]
MDKQEEIIPVGDGSDSFSVESRDDTPRSEGGERRASKSNDRMQKAKQQLKMSKDKIIHSLSAGKKSKSHPRRVEHDDDEPIESTGPNTAFFSPPSFQLTQIIHDSQCFVPRQGHSCAAGGGDVLIFGGQDAEGQFLNDFIRYIPGLNAFEPMKKVKGQIPTPRTGATMVNWVKPTTNREHIFLFGGRGPGGDIATASLYDPGSRTWTAVGGIKKPPKRSSHVSVVFEKVFVHGGLSGDNVLNDMWMWDGEEWSQVRYDKSTEPMHSSCVFDSNWVIISGGYSGGWISNYVLSDMHTYDLQANCWFSVELCGMRSTISLTHLVLISPFRTVFSFGAHDTETGVGAVSSDVYRMSPLITYVSFAALRNQVESMSEVINLSFDSQSEGVGRAIRRVDALMKRLETAEKEIEGLRTANEYLTRQLEAFQGTERKRTNQEDEDEEEEADFQVNEE